MYKASNVREALEALEALKKKGYKKRMLGEGIQGRVVRLVLPHSDGATTQVEVAAKIIAELNITKLNAKIEQNIHTKLWKGLNRDCKQYFTEPLTTNEFVLIGNKKGQFESVILQALAMPHLNKKYEMLTLDNFLNKIEKKIRNTKNSKSATKYVIASVMPELKKELHKALDCLHKVGIAHGDLWEDNVMVWFNENMTEFGIKIIDFGGAVNNVILLKERQSFDRKAVNNVILLKERQSQNRNAVERMFKMLTAEFIDEDTINNSNNNRDRTSRTSSTSRTRYN
jgi:tRNA A-37 threonylcarbamoyl transferase component Bud32